MFSLKGKNGVIAGCAQGIGLGVAKHFVKEGVNLVMGDISEQGKREADALGVPFVKTDVSKESDVENLIKTAHDKYGKLDIVVNNAGVMLPEEYIATMNTEKYHKTFAINLDGCMYGMKYGAQYMKDGGSIINTASVGGVFNFFAGYGPYCASKAAIISLTKTAAIELAARNIRVNCVLPGTIDTPMAHEEGCEDELALNALIHPMGRMGEVEEIVPLYHFLAAGECSFMTGSAIACDGGYLSGPNNDMIGQIMPCLLKGQ
ncbi:SDR family oxidoreductase [Ruminococcaceae bacterium OttesenSCG-928-I18]|nr:SDR family oxidoreductase [Ruminococcaceae bacterium OttesenSCG-928-I18]